VNFAALQFVSIMNEHKETRQTRCAHESTVQRDSSCGKSTCQASGSLAYGIFAFMQKGMTYKQAKEEVFRMLKRKRR